MSIDFTPLTAQVEQFAVSLDQFAEFCIHYVLLPSCGLLALAIGIFGLWACCRADRCGVTLEEWIGARLLLQSTNLHPVEVLLRVKERDA